MAENAGWCIPLWIVLSIQNVFIWDDKWQCSVPALRQTHTDYDVLFARPYLYYVKSSHNFHRINGSFPIEYISATFSIEYADVRERRNRSHWNVWPEFNLGNVLFWWNHKKFHQVNIRCGDKSNVMSKNFVRLEYYILLKMNMLQGFGINAVTVISEYKTNSAWWCWRLIRKLNTNFWQFWLDFEISLKKIILSSFNCKP